jgi:hypothetical protein
MPIKPSLVTNTSPLVALAAALDDFGVIGQVAVLVVPGEVLAELQAGVKRDNTVEILERAGFCRILPVYPALPVALSSSLGLGEAAVIHTALIEAIPTVVLDERKGRRWAAMHGLRVTGSLGMLLALHRRGLIGSVADAVAKMKSKGIHLSPSLVDGALRLAGEKQ